MSRMQLFDLSSPTISAPSSPSSASCFDFGVQSLRQDDVSPASIASRRKDLSFMTPKPMAWKPRSVEEVGKVMDEMDRLHQTTFQDWIRNEKNIAYFCTFKRSIVLDYYHQDRMQAITALKWISCGWSTASVAELIIKLFYNIRLSSYEFGSIVAEMTADFETDNIYDLINVLLIGESAESCVAFLCHFMGFTETNDPMLQMTFPERINWSLAEALGLIENLATTLRWKEPFLETFLVELATLTLDDPLKQRAMIATLHKEFHKGLMTLKLDDMNKTLKRGLGSSSDTISSQASSSKEQHISFGDLEDDESNRSSITMTDSVEEDISLSSIDSLQQIELALECLDIESSGSSRASTDTLVSETWESLPSPQDHLSPPPSTPILSRKTYSSQSREFDTSELDRTLSNLERQIHNKPVLRKCLDLFLFACEMILEQAFEDHSALEI